MSKEIELDAGKTGVAFNSAGTVGSFPTREYATNETRTATFFAEYLREWAENVEEAFGSAEKVEIVFTPDKPMVAQVVTDDDEEEPVIGIGVAPIKKPGENE